MRNLEQLSSERLASETSSYDWSTPAYSPAQNKLKERQAALPRRIRRLGAFAWLFQKLLVRR